MAGRVLCCSDQLPYGLSTLRSSSSSPSSLAPQAQALTPGKLLMNVTSLLVVHRLAANGRGIESTCKMDNICNSQKTLTTIQAAT